jgi:hypothetical protein
MRYLLLFPFFFLIAPATQASDAYITGQSFQFALEDYYSSATVGVGEKANSCLLCHSSASGGFGNLNPFGVDFNDAAIDQFGQGNQLVQAQLELVIGDAMFRAADSDGDGDSNEEEFLANTDPADTTPLGGAAPGGDAGGCGMIAPHSRGPSPPPAALLILLPLALLAVLRWRRLSVAE